jgi:leucyl/phenylalanyl-tRNA--protein transferase
VLTWLGDEDPFPPTTQALGPDSDAPGLLAVGGGLTVSRLEDAYRRGIFPWFSPGQPVLWWSPDPRMVLPVAEFRLHRSLKKTLRAFLATPGCEIRFDSAFDRVIAQCAGTRRDGQHGTWIVPALRRAYTQWQRAGAVHSVETWAGGQLVGGLYGVGIGRMFFGESMFSHATDASKIALAALVAFCRGHGIELIDCQQATAHLASFGAREVARVDFERHLSLTLGLPGPPSWSYDPRHWSHLLPEFVRRTA